MDHLSVRATVDLMILDYLLALSIGGIVSVIKKEKTHEEVNWMVESAESESHRDLHKGTSDLLCPGIWTSNCVSSMSSTSFASGSPPKDHALDNFVPLSDIGVKFMNLCRFARDNVSWTRWFDLGARFMIHAIIEEGERLPEPLNKLRNWETKTNPIDAHWEVSRTLFLEHMPSPYGTTGPATREQLDTLFPLSELESEFTGFVEDFMDILDAPLLLQLEQGQLQGWTPEETRRIRLECLRTL
ncbi:hypothetical protein N7541_000875 [Penicillium brevicompactum]|uniref:Uncharacterized protein n=1 Tax=Penicillium brevicompactum TaxID=5074 RepID=A0A9W9RXK5_PENBR|nr:hypothetical protein N7541_000875 [Penicillium brevicompactum]